MALFSLNKKWFSRGVLLAVFFGAGGGSGAFAMFMPTQSSPFRWGGPGPYSNPYQTNLNFYGNPWGQVPPAYFYPSLTPFPGIPPANYFMPHFPSPYGPGNYCPTCNPYSPIPVTPQQNQNQWHIMS